VVKKCLERRQHGHVAALLFGDHRTERLVELCLQFATTGVMEQDSIDAELFGGNDGANPAERQQRVHGVDGFSVTAVQICWTCCRPGNAGRRSHVAAGTPVPYCSIRVFGRHHRDQPCAVGHDDCAGRQPCGDVAPPGT
jgi:hypothetical protein